MSPAPLAWFFQFPRFPLNFFSFSADSFETMLKSLLGYQSGLGCGAMEAVQRKKAYQRAIDRTLENNFQLVLKVGDRG